MMSVGQLHTYIGLDWEIGITNEFKVMQDQGITKAQLMEIVMSAQIYAGIRGLEGCIAPRGHSSRTSRIDPSRIHCSPQIGTTTSRTSKLDWTCRRAS